VRPRFFSAMMVLVRVAVVRWNRKSRNASSAVIL
jgi:hypothetical protein